MLEISILMTVFVSLSRVDVFGLWQPEVVLARDFKSNN